MTTFNQKVEEICTSLNRRETHFLLHDNAHQYDGRFDKGDTGNNGLVNREAPSLQPYLVGDFHLFGPMKMRLGEHISD
jgi:hypothetical protein